MNSKYISGIPLIKTETTTFSKGTITAHTTLLSAGAHLSLLGQITDFNYNDQLEFISYFSGLLERYFTVLTKYYPKANVPRTAEDNKQLFSEFILNIFTSPIAKALRNYPEILSDIKLGDTPQERAKKIKQKHPDADLSTKLFFEAEIITTKENRHNKYLCIEITNQALLPDYTVEDIHYKLNPRNDILDLIERNDTLIGNTSIGSGSVGLILARQSIEELQGKIIFSYFEAQNRITFHIELPLFQ